MRDALSFDDVLLVPQHSEASSRKEICTSNSLRLLGDFSLPIEIYVAVFKCY